MIGKLRDEDFNKLVNAANSKGYRKQHNNYESPLDVIEFCAEQKRQAIAGIYLLAEHMKGGKATSGRILVLEQVTAGLDFLNEVEIYLLTRKLQKRKDKIQLTYTKEIRKFLKEIGFK
jgi:hypothetical protein